MKAIACAALQLAMVVLVLALTASPAAAYVRTKTTDGLPYFWNRTHVVLNAYVGDPPKNLGRDDVVRAVEGAAASWSHGAVPCAGLHIEVVTNPEASAPVEPDLTNRLTFRRQRWCKEPAAAGEPCYSSETLAVTSVFVRKTDGIIIDADIEVNAVDFTWDDLVKRPQVTGAADLQNTLTHEMGHLLGFDHTCHVPGWPLGVDDLGRTVPECTTAAAEFHDATMSPAASSDQDVSKRTLAGDDLDAVCAIYPNIPNGTVEGSCAVTPGGSPRGSGLVPLLLLALVLARAVTGGQGPRT